MALTRRSLNRLRRLRADIGKLADGAVRQVGGLWDTAWGQLGPAWQSAVDAAAGRDRWPSAWQLARLPKVGAALQQTGQVLPLLTAASARPVVDAVTAAIAETLAAEPEILAGQAPGVPASRFAAGIARAHADLLRRQTRDRMRQTATELPGEVAAAMGRAMTRDQDPAELMSRLRIVFDTGRHRMVTTAGTEVLDAYRAAAAHVHDVNAEHLAGWVWACALDLRSCPACWAMHGTLHPLREPGPNGHPNCRCARAPLVKVTLPDGTVDYSSGLPDAQARFRALPRSRQLAVMGPARLQLLDDGDSTWADLAVRRSRKGWRDAYVPRTVADLKRLAGVR